MAESKKREGIASGGMWCVDHIKTIDKFPQESALANITSKTTAGGGCPYNVIVDLAKIDPKLPLSVSGVLGKDLDGDFLVKDIS
jgi:hypothetical protein